MVELITEILSWLATYGKHERLSVFIYALKKQNCWVFHSHWPFWKVKFIVIKFTFIEINNITGKLSITKWDTVFKYLTLFRTHFTLIWSTEQSINIETTYLLFKIQGNGSTIDWMKSCSTCFKSLSQHQNLLN